MRRGISRFLYGGDSDHSKCEVQGQSLGENHHSVSARVIGAGCALHSAVAVAAARSASVRTAHTCICMASNLLFATHLEIVLVIIY